MRWLWVLAMLASCDYVFRLDRVPDVPRPDAPSAIIGRWSELAAGRSHSCGIDNEGALWCWGRNVSGEVGGEVATRQIDEPTRIGTALWSSVVSRERHTCGIQQDQSLWCWGDNEFGQLGDSTTKTKLAPTPVPGQWRNQLFTSSREMSWLSAKKSSKETDEGSWQQNTTQG
jgi:alpha-tubulin suppressor-like RCC1 family protein